MICGQLQTDLGTPLIDKVKRTESAWERMRGLLGRAPLQPEEALWIAPCNSVHSLFMGYPLDLIFLDRQLTVIKIINNLNPWRFSAAVGAHSVVELAANTVANLNISKGSRLAWQPCAG